MRCQTQPVTFPRRGCMANTALWQTQILFSYFGKLKYYSHTRKKMTSVERKETTCLCANRSGRKPLIQRNHLPDKRQIVHCHSCFPNGLIRNIGYCLDEIDDSRPRLLKTTCIRDKDVQTCYNKNGNTACLTVGKEDL